MVKDGETQTQCEFRFNPATHSDMKAATHSDTNPATHSDLKAATPMVEIGVSGE